MCKPERPAVLDPDLDSLSEESLGGDLDEQVRDTTLEWKEEDQLGFNVDQWGGLFVSGMAEGAYVGSIEEEFDRDKIDPHEELDWCMQLVDVNGTDCAKMSSEQVITVHCNALYEPQPNGVAG